MTSHFQDGGHDVISCTTVLPPAECTHSIFPACTAGQFLICLANLGTDSSDTRFGND